METGLAIAASLVKGRIPADQSLTERLLFAMRYVRQHRSDVFFMVGNPAEDDQFRTALAAVILAGSEEDRDVIARSMKPLQALSAAVSGIPVDFGAIELDDDFIPLMKLWRESEG